MEETKTPDHDHTKSPNKPKGLLTNILIGLMAGILGAAFYGYVIKADVNSNPSKSGTKVTVLEQSAIIDLVKKVSPSVVSITSTSETSNIFGQSQAQEGAGTGIIVSDDGLILTNKHVISGATSLSVITSDNKTYKGAHVVATDPSNDIAFVKVDAKGLKAAELGDSSAVEVGQSVVAIGNALGQFQNSVTSGIISGRKQTITAGSGSESETLTNLFQTDAAINPGNSGGPLVNIAGQVIGINTAIAGEAQNIGFAIPINDAKNDLESVKNKGKITRAYLGVRYVANTKSIAAANNLPTDSGAIVSGTGTNPAVVSGSPADKAGLKEGDIIVKVNDTAVDDKNSLSSALAQYKPGDTVKITYYRDGKQQTTNATLTQADF